MSKMNSLLTELKALLTKYNATIDVGIDDCSDTHGIYGECMEIYITKGNSFKTLESHTIDGWGIDKNDIKLDKVNELTREEMALQMQETMQELRVIKEKYAKLSEAYWGK